MKSDLVSIVFSFRNEDGNLPELIRRLAAMADGQAEGFEFIFVNDCSNDRSLEILAEARAHDPRVKYITTAKRSGPAECLLAGVAAATGDAVAYMDCDLQDPPELIPEMIRLWRAGHEVVHTRRTRRYGESAVRMWLTKRAYHLIHWISNGQMPIESGDFKLLSRRAAQQLLSFREHDPYIRGLAVWMGFKQCFVEYERHPRHHGESKFSGLHRNAVKTMTSGVTSFSFLPVYLAGFAGMGGLLVSVFLVLGAVVALLAGGPAGTLAIFALAFFMWGSAMMSIGAVGLYVARMYKDIRGRPRWIVAEAVGVEVVPDRAVTGER